MEDITLQINLSPGDVNYAELTVPDLVRKHADIKTRLLVVDCCRPQKTKLIDPDQRHPLEVFNLKVDKIVEISENLLRKGLVSKVYYLRPNDPLFKHISRKYLGNLYDCTHSAGGTANMGYWAGIELPETRYVLHYDGDMLLYQEPGFRWTDEAIRHLAADEHYLSAVPRLCPPVLDQDFLLPSLHEGRPNTSFEHYWYTDFFSTRIFLLDKHRLANYLPLPRGGLRLELLLRKYGKRAFPMDPEIVLFRSLGSHGCKRLLLKNDKAWVTHPVDKSGDYLAILPKVIDQINTGLFPEKQRGYEDMQLDAWINFDPGG